MSWASKVNAHAGTKLWTVAKALFAAGLIAAIAYAVDGREALRLLRAADPGWLLAGFVALTLQTVLSALRWQLTAARLDHAFDTRFAIREYYLSQIVNQTLPGGMVGDAGRAVRARGEAGLGKSGMAVALDRASGQLGMVALMACGLVAAILPGGLTPPPYVMGAVLAICAGVIGISVAVIAAGWLPGIAGRGAEAMVRAARRAVFDRAVLWRQVALSLATAACNLAAFAACAAAIGAPLDLVAITLLVPLILFAMLVPVTVSGWGLREGMATALLPLAGLTGAEAMAASVAFGLTFLATVVPGLWPLLTPKVTPGVHTRTRWRRAPRRDDAKDSARNPR